MNPIDFDINNECLFSQDYIPFATCEYEGLDYIQCQFELMTIKDIIYQRQNMNISRLKTFLVLKNLQQEQVINLLNIDLWSCYYSSCEKQRETDEQLRIKISNQTQLCTAIFYFSSDLDFKLFESWIKQVCLIAAPKLQEEYKYIRKIGAGSQASIDVYQPFVTLKKKSYAVKSYKLVKDKNYEQKVQYIYSEIQFLRELHFCNNVINIDSVYQTNNEIQLVMKFAKFGCLSKYIKKNDLIGEDKLRIIMEQLLLAIDLMHKNGIIHRDIKPDNILILKEKNIQVCIADLGMACKSNDMKQISMKCGTPSYVDPEVLKKCSFKPQSDIFSLGSLLFNLITGNLLFKGRNSKELLLKNQYQDPITIVEQTCQHVSYECRDLLKKMLDTHQNSRPTAEQCLNHQWFQNDKESLFNLLKINKQAAIFNSGKFPNYFEEEHNFSSFMQGPDYFQDLDSSFQSVMSRQGFTPKNIRQHSQNNSGKLCYASILSENRIKGMTSKANKTSNQFEGFSNALLNQNITSKKSAFFKKKMKVPNAEEDKEDGQKELLVEGIQSKFQRSSSLNLDSKSLDFNELQIESDEISKKIINRINTGDVSQQQISLSSKNKRNNKNIQL